MVQAPALKPDTAWMVMSGRDASDAASCSRRIRPSFTRHCAGERGAVDGIVQGQAAGGAKRPASRTRLQRYKWRTLLLTRRKARWRGKIEVQLSTSAAWLLA